MNWFGAGSIAGGIFGTWLWVKYPRLGPPQAVQHYLEIPPE